MKANSSKASVIVAAALMGLTTGALAQQDQVGQFIPLEKLHPQDRAVLAERVREIESEGRIDWQSIVVGINERGELVLRDRNLSKEDIIASPSCWAD